jgi:hypothetical protein
MPMRLEHMPDLQQTPSELPQLSAPQQYHVQFTANEEYARLVERAKALTARQAAGQSLSELHLKAMRLLVESLEKQQFAAIARSDAAPEPKSAEQPRQRGSRHIPASIGRAVFQRDDARCTYVDERGVRCREASALELHHLDPFATGGVHTLDNLTLHCHAHNELAAELDFGPAHIAARKQQTRHASLRSQSSHGLDKPLLGRCDSAKARGQAG